MATSAVAVQRGIDTGASQQRGQQFAMIELDHEVVEPEPLQDFADGGQHLDLDDGRSRADRVDVALVELAESPPRRTVGAPHRLDLVPLEVLRQFAAVLGDDARERYGQVVAQGKVGFARRLVLATAQDLENELVPLLAVLAGQRLDILERGRLERLESVALIHVLDDAG